MIIGEIMDEEDFKKTNVNLAIVVKVDLNIIGEFKKSLIDVIKEYDGKIIYHTVSPYKLTVEKKKE